MLQNKAAKLVLNKPLYSSATDALNQLGWLNLKQRRHFHRCLYVYKCVNGIASHKLELSRNSDVHRYNPRCKDHLRLLLVKRNWGKQRTCYHAFKDWNALDSDLNNILHYKHFNELDTQTMDAISCINLVSISALSAYVNRS